MVVATKTFVAVRFLLGVREAGFFPGLLQAKFLTPEERAWLAEKLAAERKAKEAVRTFTLWQSLRDRKVLLLAVNYFGIVTASFGMLIFIPQIIQSLGRFDNMTIGWLTMIPYVCGVIAMVGWGHASDRANERRWYLLMASVFAAGGLILAGATMGTWWASSACRLRPWDSTAPRGRSSPCRRCS
jgi:ACS family tartrate transporter-like MFS transporter